jgi:TonB family protein
LAGTLKLICTTPQIRVGALPAYNALNKLSPAIRAVIPGVSGSACGSLSPPMEHGGSVRPYPVPQIVTTEPRAAKVKVHSAFHQVAPPTGLQRPTGVYSIGNGVSAPSVIQKQEPEHSEEARLLKLSGAVGLSIIVGTDGIVHNPRITRSLGLGLDEKASEAVSTWRFKPGEKERRPVPVLANVEVNFRLLVTSSWHLAAVDFSMPDGAVRPFVLKASHPMDLDSRESGAVALSFDVDENGMPINFHPQVRLIQNGKLP